jgi:UDP:flavonoid glycosyltransferase YjiC (YdhE family)
MQVLFTTLREKSHFFAMLPFIGACQRRGHSVAVAAPQDLAERIAATGARFFPVAHPGDEGLRPIWARFREVSGDDITRIAIGELFAGACAGAAIPTLIQTIEQWKPAIVLRESHEFAGIVAAEKLGIPHARIAICAPGAEARIRSLAAPAVDAHRRSVGLAPDPAGDHMARERALTLFPASYEAAELEAAQLYRFRAPRTNAPALPNWWGGQQGAFVYATLGTVTGGFDMIHAVYRVLLEAVAGLPIRVLLTLGTDLPMGVLGDVPANVHVERFVPQDDVIPHAALVLCHGGSGTVLGALGAGVPIVATPLFADQPHNAARLAEIGAGLAMPTVAMKPAELRAALTRVLQEESFRTTARRLAQDMASLPLLDEAALEIERLCQHD